MRAWTRMDLHSKTYKTTNKEGPTWWAHEARRWHGRDLVDDFEGNVAEISCGACSVTLPQAVPT